MRFLALAAAVLALIAGLALGRLWLALAGGALTALGAFDLLQRRHASCATTRSSGTPGSCWSRSGPSSSSTSSSATSTAAPSTATRAARLRAREGRRDEQAFGTERDVYEAGYECLIPSTAPLDPPEEPTRVRVGGPDCTQPYDMALLSSTCAAQRLRDELRLAVRRRPAALNRGAAAGGFAHDTGEGGLSDYHLAAGDLVWEIGSGYFGCRTHDGGFDRGEFRDKAAHEHVSCVSLKLSQGAKPGIGGAAGCEGQKEIAGCATCRRAERHLPRRTPRVLHAARARALHRPDARAGRRQAGRLQALRRLAPRVPRRLQGDAGGGRHARLHRRRRRRGRHRAPRPLEFADHVGTPLTEGLMTVHNALVGAGLRDRIRIGASGKIATGSDLVKRLVAGRRLHQRGPRDDVRRRLHPGPALPHQHLPRRRRHPGPAARPGPRRRRQDRSACGATRRRPSAARCRSWRRWASTTRAQLRPHMLRPAGRPAHRAAPTRSCTTGSPPASCSPTPPDSWAADWNAADHPDPLHPLNRR